jgi:putative PIG3 family NAD(P)H quinone oxidoreductase
VRAVTIVDGRVAIDTRPDPEPGPGEVIVRVRGAGLNRADLAQLAGRYPAPPGAPADIPGLEFAGEVAALGEGVRDLNAGDAVFGIVGGGAQAELVRTRADHCARVPSRMSLVEAGAVPEAFITAHDALFTIADVAAGETVLVHAVGSGVGTAALQLARAVGATVVGTARTQAKLDRCATLGLKHAILAPADLDPPALVAAITDAVGAADVVVDLLGGNYVVVDQAVAAPRGRIVLVGALAGGRAELSLGAAMGKRLRITGTVLRARDSSEKAAVTTAFARDVLPWLADGMVEPVVERVLPLAAAAEAYELLASNTVFGKVVLAVD